MKTQISQLRSGTKNQVLNSKVDYSTLPQATSHNGHAGTNAEVCENVWESVIAENPETMSVIIFGLTLNLTANWSLSKKSVSYFCSLTPEQVAIFGIAPSKTKSASFSIQGANTIFVSNGQKSFTHVCPSLVFIN